METDKNFKDSNLVAAGYKEPSWSSICSDEQYSLDVLKDGVFIDNIKLSDKPYYIIGRFKTCDLVFEHPSLSRFHAVLQYCSEKNDENREKGWYLMDLDSTHGSIINKVKINPMAFHRIRSGYVLKFGGSSRLYIVNGPDYDKDPLSKHTWTELNEMKDKAKLIQSVSSVDNNSTGCMWGMDYEFDEDSSCFVNPETVQKYPHEKLYKDDPKKVIKWYFDREGVEEGPAYCFTNNGFNKSTCSLELPVFGENGHRMVAEVSGSEKKKEMVERCALQACYLLDEIEELYKTGGSSNVPRKDLNYYKDKDYYSSEEDEFFDRTGDLEHKRLQRMRRFGVVEDKSEIVEKKLEAKDIDSALVKLQRLEVINNDIMLIEQQLEDAKRAVEADQTASEMDEIEKYLEAIQSGTLMNRQARLKLKAKLFELQREENLLRKQLKLTIPVTESMRKTLFSNPEKRDESQATKYEEAISQENKNDTEVVKDMAVEIIKDTEKAEKVQKVEITEDTEKDEDIQQVEGTKKKISEECEEMLTKENETKKAVKRTSTDDDIPRVNSSRKVPKLILEEDASDWLPPQDQTGDGRTSLNDQLGY